MNAVFNSYFKSNCQESFAVNCCLYLFIRLARVAVSEIGRLKSLWRTGQSGGADGGVVAEMLGTEAEWLDLFDRCQLETVLKICRESASLSAAGRALFASSRLEKKSANHADRLLKYLARFGLKFEEIGAHAGRY